MTSELEYQSQHTELLNFQNEEMREEMKKLRVELQEHREVEKELGKRSHFCNRVIKKYKEQIKMLEEEIKQRRDLQSQSSKLPAQPARQPTFGNYRSDLTQFLQKRIQDYEKKQEEAHQQLNEIQREYQNLFQSIQSQKAKYQKVVVLLSDFINQLITQDPSLVNG